jgi:hypothetical protein
MVAVASLHSAGAGECRLLLVLTAPTVVWKQSSMVVVVFAENGWDDVVLVFAF